MKVIFLDIDGVLQPYRSEKRFKHDLTELCYELTKEKNIDYTQYNEYDVGAAYYDWDFHAVECIRHIIKKADAKIVVSSDWRDEKRPYKVRDLLGIYDLDKYWIADTEEIEEDDIENSNEYKKYDYRTRQIKKFLRKHPEVENYVAIDDMYLLKGLEGHFICTNNLITLDQANICISMLENDSEQEQIFERLALNEDALEDLENEIERLREYVRKRLHDK